MFRQNHTVEIVLRIEDIARAMSTNRARNKNLQAISSYARNLGKLFMLLPKGSSYISTKFRSISETRTGYYTFRSLSI